MSELQTTDQLSFIERIIKEKQMDLDIRFFKRQLLSAKGDNAIQFQNQINKLEQIRKGEMQYLDFINEMYKDVSANMPKS